MTHQPHEKEVLRIPKFGDLPDIQLPNIRKIFRYAGLLHKVREYPGTWACIAVFDEGSPGRTQTRMQSVSGEVNRYLRKYYPLEIWDISRRTIPDTWCRRELWVRYNGEVTPEQALEAKNARRALWEKGRINGEQKRAARETLERIRGLAANRELRLLGERQRKESLGG